MMIQIVIVLFFLMLTSYAIFQKDRAPLVSAVMIVIAMLGVLFTLAPKVATDLAHLLGVGRGTDLILYLFILVSLTAILNLHLRLRANAEFVTALARHVALQTVKEPNSEKGKDP